jgi:hypothetical protein
MVHLVQDVQVFAAKIVPIFVTKQQECVPIAKLAGKEKVVMKVGLIKYFLDYEEYDYAYFEYGIFFMSDSSHY